MNALKSLVGNDPTSKRIALEKQTATSIIGLQAALAQQSAEQLKELSANSAHIKAKNLPAVIQQRQTDAIALLQSRQQQLQSSLDQLSKAQTNNDDSQRQQALTTLSQQLEDWGGAKQAKTDFKHLPWGSPSSTVRAPISAANIKAMSLQRFNLKQGQYTFNPSLLAQNNTNTLDPSKMSPQELWDNATPTVFNNKTSIGQWQQIAYSGMTTSNQNQWPVLASLPATVQAADTAANDDAQITPAITQLATTLHKNPAEIYKWVYDNIEYIPTYGSIQGSDMTLQTKRGNAFDTSSLLISLLRASGIPARYVYGSIDVNPTILKDWVGGVNNVDAAQNLMGQGGIPNVALISGSQVTAVRMEHVWVEANLNFNPARGGVQQGATNPNASSTWIPLDASYKTHTRTAGINVAQVVPYTGGGINAMLTQGATVDTENGYVQNLNVAGVQSNLSNYYDQVDQYYTQNNLDPALGEILGLPVVNSLKSHMLSPSLPYAVESVVADYQSLPNTMRNSLNINIYASAEDKSSENPLLSFTATLPSLAGKKIGITYQPASQDDATALTSYRTNGSTSIAAYLINVKPCLVIDDVIVATGSPVMMGQAVLANVGISSSIPNMSSQAESIMHAGDESILGLNLAGTTYNLMYQSYIKKFGTPNTASDNLQLTAISFWMMEDLQQKMISQPRGLIVNRLPSYGWFSSPLTVKQRFGVPTSGYYKGRSMDIVKSSIATIDLSGKIPLDALLQIGVYDSYLEGAIFDKLFKQKVGTSVSAISLINDSVAAGNKLFSITSQNFNSVRSQLAVSTDALQEISDAVNAGMIVITPDHDIVKGNWTGLGYIVFDPRTGSGAYLIDGGLNGASQDPACVKEEEKKTSPAVDEMNPLVAVAVLLGIAAIAVASDGVGLIALAGTAEAATAAIAAAAGRLLASKVAVRVVQYGVGAQAVFYAEGAMASPAGLPEPLPQISFPGAEFSQCLPERLAELEAIKKAACNDVKHSCKPRPDGYPASQEYCDDIKEKLNNGLLCYSARVNVMNECFGGGDMTHKLEADEAIRSINTCQERQLQYCTDKNTGCVR